MSAKRRREETTEVDSKERRISIRQLGPEESLLLALPRDILKLVISDYVGFQFYPALVLVCTALRDFIGIRGACYFVPEMAKRGYFHLARWAYEKGCPFSIYWKESHLKAAKIGDFDALKWMVAVTRSKGFGVHINTEVFEALLENGQHEALEFVRSVAMAGEKRYKKVLYLKALLCKDMTTIVNLANQRIPPCRRFIEEVAARDAPEYLYSLFDNRLLSISCLGYRCSNAARAGSMKILKWLVDKGFHLNEYFYIDALGGKQYETLEWLCGLHCVESFGTRAANWAAYNVDFTGLDILANSRALPEWQIVICAASRNESTELLIWAISRGLLSDRSVEYYTDHPDCERKIAWLKGQLKDLGIEHNKWYQPS
jgi:hypothetical protein